MVNKAACQAFWEAAVRGTFMGHSGEKNKSHVSSKKPAQNDNPARPIASIRIAALRPTGRKHALYTFGAVPPMNPFREMHRGGIVGALFGFI